MKDSINSENNTQSYKQNPTKSCYFMESIHPRYVLIALISHWFITKISLFKNIFRPDYVQKKLHPTRQFFFSEGLFVIMSLFSKLFI